MSSTGNKEVWLNAPDKYDSDYYWHSLNKFNVLSKIYGLVIICL